MSEPIDIDAITAKAKQERATIDQVWKYVDKAWEDALKAVAELATMYGIDPDILYVHDSEEKYAESRLYVADESYVPDSYFYQKNPKTNVWERVEPSFCRL